MGGSGCRCPFPPAMRALSSVKVQPLRRRGGEGGGLTHFPQSPNKCIREEGEGGGELGPQPRRRAIIPGDRGAEGGSRNGGINWWRRAMARGRILVKTPRKVGSVAQGEGGGLEGFRHETDTSTSKTHPPRFGSLGQLLEAKSTKYEG